MAINVDEQRVVRFQATNFPTQISWTRSEAAFDFEINSGSALARVDRFRGLPADCHVVPPRNDMLNAADPVRNTPQCDRVRFSKFNIHVQNANQVKRSSI